MFFFFLKAKFTREIINHAGFINGPTHPTPKTNPGGGLACWVICGSFICWAEEDPVMQVPHPTPNPPIFFCFRIWRSTQHVWVWSWICVSNLTPTKIPILFSLLNQLPFYSSSWGGGVFSLRMRVFHELWQVSPIWHDVVKSCSIWRCLEVAALRPLPCYYRFPKRGTSSGKVAPLSKWKWFGGSFWDSSCNLEPS